MRINVKDKLLSIILVICIFMTTCALSGCKTENTGEQLIGKWEHYSESEQISNSFGGDPFTIKTRTELNFKSDGSFSDMIDEYAHFGTYTIDDNNKLTITRELTFTEYDYCGDAQSVSVGKWYISGDKLYLGKLIFSRIKYFDLLSSALKSIFLLRIRITKSAALKYIASDLIITQKSR